MEGGAQGVSPAPQHLWGGDGSLHSLPLQQPVLLEVCAGLMDMVVQAGLQKGLRGYRILFLTQAVPRTSSSSPQQGRVEQHPCEKGGFVEEVPDSIFGQE